MEGLNTSIPKEAILPENKNNAEKKKAISTIEINGIKIETQKEYFEYPEYIQKETGILGYDRTVVLKDSLFEYLKKDIMNRYSIDIESMGINDLDSMLSLDNGGYSDDVSRRPLELRCSMINTEACYSLINILSNGEYPVNCFTHELGAYANKDESEKYNRNFVNNKFFIQKIYDMDNIKEKESTFDHTNEDAYGSNLTIFNKKSGNQITSIKIKDLKNPEYYDGLKKGEFFACTPYSGINVNINAFFFNEHISLKNNKPCFGFAVSKDDNFLKEYLDKALNIYTKKLKLNKEWKDIYHDAGLGSIIQELILLDEKILNISNIEFAPYNHGPNLRLNLYEEIVVDIIKNIELKNDIKVNSYLESGVNLPYLAYRKKIGSKFNERMMGDLEHRAELRIPVFIGLEEEIPQLRWGHAKYSHFMSSKGFNFIEFKHSDHLPQKQID